MILSKELVGRAVKIRTGEFGSILAYLGDATKHPYSIMVKRENSTSYYFVNKNGKLMGDSEYFVTSVLDSDNLDFFKNKHKTNPQGDSNIDLKTEQNTSNCAGNSPSEASGTITITLTLPEGTNALEGEFRANNGKYYKVSVKNG